PHARGRGGDDNARTPAAAGHRDRGRRPGRLPRDSQGPTAALRGPLPYRARRIRAGGPGGAARDEAARRTGGGAARRLPDAADERDRVLELAMDVYPGARRALLTAYADTGAAI